MARLETLPQLPPPLPENVVALATIVRPSVGRASDCRSYPRGTDNSVVLRDGLERAWFLIRSGYAVTAVFVSDGFWEIFRRE